MWSYDDPVTGDMTAVRCSKTRCLTGGFCAYGRIGGVDGNYSSEAEQRAEYARNIMCRSCRPGFKEFAGVLLFALWIGKEEVLGT
jgi:hypothetical protein